MDYDTFQEGNVALAPAENQDWCHNFDCRVIFKLRTNNQRFCSKSCRNTYHLELRQLIAKESD